MAFENYVYDTNQGVTFQIRLDTDQATIAGGVIGASDFPAHVRVSTGKREFGIQPRHLILRRVVNPGASQAIRTTRLAICTQAVFDGISAGSDITVNGLQYRVGSKVGELYK